MLDKLFGGYGTLIAYGLAAALVVGAFWYVYDLGGDNRQLVWEAKYATLERNYAAAALAEGTRQASANQEAKQREAVVIATIEAQSVALRNLQRRLDDEADNDPAAVDGCISDAGRMRLNQVH